MGFRGFVGRCALWMLGSRGAWVVVWLWRVLGVTVRVLEVVGSYESILSS